MKATVTNCARCGQSHHYLEFLRLERPMGDWTHYALCPTNGQPIMLRIEEAREESVAGPSEHKGAGTIYTLGDEGDNDDS